MSSAVYRLVERFGFALVGHRVIHYDLVPSDSKSPEAFKARSARPSTPAEKAMWNALLDVEFSGNT